MERINNLIKKPISLFLKLSKLKKIIIVLIIAAIVIAVQQYFTNVGKNGYITEKAKMSDVVEVVSETGNIVSTGRTDIYSPANGVIEEMLVQNGDIVKKDQEIFKVKSTATVQEQQAAYATYLTAQATLNAALSTNYDLRSDMFDKWKEYYDLATNDTYENEDNSPNEENRVLVEFHTTKDDWLGAEQEYKDQQTVIAKAQASVNSTWLLYQATQNATVLAQADGTIANISYGIGESVDAYTGPTSTAKPVLSIANFSKYTVKITVNESDIHKIKVGQKVSLQIDAFKNIDYEGVVERVDDIGANENDVIKYNVYVEILNPDENLRFGMSIDVDIITNEQRDVLTVPNSAVKPYKNGRAVRVYNRQAKEIDYILVEIGIKGEKNTQIIKGIDKGQEVITSLKNEQIQRESVFGF